MTPDEAHAQVWQWLLEHQDRPPFSWMLMDPVGDLTDTAPGGFRQPALAEWVKAIGDVGIRAEVCRFLQHELQGVPLGGERGLKERGHRERHQLWILHGSDDRLAEMLELDLTQLPDNSPEVDLVVGFYRHGKAQEDFRAMDAKPAASLKADVTWTEGRPVTVKGKGHKRALDGKPLGPRSRPPTGRAVRR
jgi:hypothetical protein